MKYLRVINGTTSHASGYEFKFNDVNIAPFWNPTETSPEKQGGFNFSNEQNIIRWIIRGDTLCDVEIPDDAEVMAIQNKSTPGGVFRTNKIILKNPRPITEWLAIEMYRKSNLPENTYFQILTIAGGKGFEKLQDLIVADKINANNISRAIEIYEEYSNCMHEYPTSKIHHKTMFKLKLLKAHFQNKKIDLHSHTTFSDSAISPQDLINLAKSENVGILSVTDHDNVNFYQSISNHELTIPDDVILIPGIELTCKYNGTLRDILGYNIDWKVVKAWLDKYYSFEKRLAKQKMLLDQIKYAVRKHSMKFDDSIQVHEGKKSEAYITMFKELGKYQENIEKVPELSHISLFYRHHFTNPASPFFIDEACDSPTILEAINLIHSASGLAFIAHPYKYRMTDDETIKYIEDCISYGVDGLELHHSTNEQQHLEKLQAIAMQYSLFTSGGSDYHGGLKPEIKLDCGINNNMQIEFRHIEPWLL